MHVNKVFISILWNIRGVSISPVYHNADSSNLRPKLEYNEFGTIKPCYYQIFTIDHDRLKL